MTPEDHTNRERIRELLDTAEQDSPEKAASLIAEIRYVCEGLAFSLVSMAVTETYDSVCKSYDSASMALRRAEDYAVALKNERRTQETLAWMKNQGEDS